jgi:hypothetical protein
MSIELESVFKRELAVAVLFQERPEEGSASQMRELTGVPLSKVRKNPPTKSPPAYSATAAMLLPCDSSLYSATIGS